MIRTKDLVGFMKDVNMGNNMLTFREIEYIGEIVARLQMHDELKEGIKKIIANLCPRPSSGVDK